ncbi:MAG: aKG-HExxH-type peptide beta-hydroxylase [Nannocystales bacterium]
MKWPDAEGLVLDDLTVPRPGSSTLRGVWSRALRRTVLDLLSLEAPPTCRTWGVSRAAVAGLAKSNPGALFSVLRQPGVGTRIRCLRDPSRDDIDRVAVCESLQAVLAHELGASWTGPVVLDATFTSWRERGEVRGGRVMTQDEHGLLFAPLGAGVMLCRADDSPLAMHEAHPDKDGNRTSLGGQAQSQWVESLRAALELIGVGLPDLHAEIELALHQIVPVGYEESRHLSASFQENLGTAYMTLHPQRMTMVEAIVHEFSHNKLNALLEIDPVLHNAFEPLFSSPVRPDPRPLHGVLLAVHAFTAVESLYRSLRRQGHRVSEGQGFEQRLRTIAEGNREGLETLENAEPTAAGKSLLSELRRLAV